MFETMKQWRSWLGVALSVALVIIAIASDLQVQAAINRLTDEAATSTRAALVPVGDLNDLLSSTAFGLQLSSLAAQVEEDGGAVEIDRPPIELLASAAATLSQEANDLITQIDDSTRRADAASAAVHALAATNAPPPVQPRLDEVSALVDSATQLSLAIADSGEDVTVEDAERIGSFLSDAFEVVGQINTGLLTAERSATQAATGASRNVHLVAVIVGVIGAWFGWQNWIRRKPASVSPSETG